MAVTNFLPNMRDPNVSTASAELYDKARQGQADYLAKLAGIRQTGSLTKGEEIKNSGSQYALDQQKMLNALFAKHFDPKTQKLDPVGFTADATAAGILSPSAMQTPMTTTAGNLKTGEGAAESAFRIRSFGGNPSEITKPSMAPASPTTGQGNTEAPSIQDFFSGLSGKPPARPTYDPSASVAAQAKVLAAVPGERGKLAKEGLTGKAPGFRELIAAEANRYLGAEPTAEDFAGNLEKYNAALLERRNKEAGLDAHLQEFAGALVPSGLSMAQGIQSKNQNKADFDLRGNLTGWADAGVPDRGMSEGVATKLKGDLATVRTLETITTKLGSGSASDDAIREAAKKLTGRIDANTLLGVFPSLTKNVAEDGIRKGGTEWLFNQLRGNQEKAAKLVEQYVTGEKTRIKENIKTASPGVDLKKMEAYVNGKAEQEKPVRKKLTSEELKKLLGRK